MPGERRGTFLVSLVCVLLLCAGTAVAEEADVRIEIDSEGEATTNAPTGTVLAEDHDPPERYAWQLALDGNYTLANVTIDAAFPIDRGRQLVPLADGSHFVEVDDPASVDRAATVYNLSTTEDAWHYELGLPGPGETNLTLERDIQPPSLEIVDVGNVTEIGFDVTTNTSEIALAKLAVETPEGEQLQTYPTNRPGPWQQFPVQGLDANTTYVAAVDAWDWSRNEAERQTVEVTTAEEPNPPEPIVEPVRPAPNSTVSAEGIVVEASYSEQGWPIVEEDVTVFFDKERVPLDEVEIGDGSITFTADGPLDARPYSVSVEVPNTAGGTGIARWSFQVEEPATQSAPGPAVAAVLVAVLGGLALAPRRQ